MYSDFRLEWFIPDNNYVANFLSMNEDLFSTGTDCSVAESGRLRPSAAACANSGRCGIGRRNRENANCGDPVG